MEAKRSPITNANSSQTKRLHVSEKIFIISQKLKNTIIDKMLTYATETWTLAKSDRRQLDIFERKVYRRILGPII
jgi:hypothetical protein